MNSFSLGQYHKPALYTFAGIAAGILVSEHFVTEHSVFARISLCLFLFTCATSWLLFRKNITFARYSVLFLTSVLLGNLLHSSGEALYEESLLRKLASLVKEEVVLYGEVTTQLDESEFGTMYSLRADSARVGEWLYPISGVAAIQIPLLSKGDIFFLPKEGDRLTIYGELQTLERKRNPYQINYTEKIRREYDVDAAVYLRSRYDYVITEHVGKYQENILVSLRKYVSAVLSSAISNSTASGFVEAVLIGADNSLPPETWQEFNRAGLTHILVVSGFNLGLVALFIYYLLRLLRIRSRVLRSTITLAIVITYLLVIGGGPSILRATIVVVVFLSARIFERKTDLLNITAAAACINLVINPNELFNVGFQLSYGAVFSLAVIAPQLDRLFLSDSNNVSAKNEIIRVVSKTFIGTVAVFLGTLPILIYHYQQVSIIGLFVNILIIPVSGLITILGMLTIPLSLVSSFFASLYGEGLELLVKAALGVSQLASSLPFAMITLPRPTVIGIVLFASILIYCIFSQTRERLVGRMITSIGLSLLLFVMNVPFVYAITNAESKLTVVFFDVGQGDATLIRTPSGKHYMIDFGGRGQSGRSQAERSILPFLRAEGISSIDGAFVSHMHYDHYAGLEPLLKAGYIDKIYSCGERTENQTAYTLDSISYHSKIPVENVLQGEKIIDGELSMYVLSPDAKSDNAVEDKNHRSIIIKLVYGTTSFLFLADAESDAEKEIVDRYGMFLKSDVVKVAHHGSRTSSTPELIGLTKPSYAVISVGERNAFGHPNANVLERWYKSGARVMSTAHDGAVILQSDGQTLKQINWK
ncbi:MAG TPA: DNA internalization-related competence protein ComEC/Rec2 [Candidatus Kapabacteria bacterium]